MQASEIRYEFGANWRSFVARALNDQRVAQAVASLRELLNTETLRGRSFLDMGCGSGLFSLAACLLEADLVVSFDFDPDSVQATTLLRDRQRIPAERWTIRKGSALDQEFLATLEPADVVYSWGVLHHTGDMWRAIDNAVGMVKAGGLLAISIYNNVQRIPDTSKMWWHIKRFYTRSPGPVRRLMEGIYALNFVGTRLITLRNPFAAMTNRDGAGRRGMDFWHDARDWLGGFPYEYATAGELFLYLHRKHRLELRYLRTAEGNACNEFLLQRPARPA